jgi:hypothetical protein
MISFLLEILFAFLSCFPGIIIVAKLFKWRILAVKSVILGVLLWYFIFAFLSIVVGCLSYSLIQFFYCFTIVSIVITIAEVFNAITKRKLTFTVSVDSAVIPTIALIIALLIFFTLILAFHPIFLEFDGIWAYFPYAKGLLENGGFYHNSYVASDLDMTRMPLMPLYYAWGLSTFGNESSG